MRPLLAAPQRGKIRVVEMHGYEGDVIHLPRAALRFPIELIPPDGFVAGDPTTWPRLDGRLEYVGGRLLYMPPCGEIQQTEALWVGHVLWAWAEQHPEFTVGGNEAGIKLGGEVRGVDAAIWRRDQLGRGPMTHHYREVPPILAVEVAGLDETEANLRAKAGWYLDHGVMVVWLVLPDTREVLVLTPAGEHRLTGHDVIPEHPDLPGLAPEVARLFAQLRR